jgi:hypothetical protein
VCINLKNEITLTLSHVDYSLAVKGDKNSREVIQRFSFFKTYKINADKGIKIACTLSWEL